MAAPQRANGVRREQRRTELTERLLAAVEELLAGGSSFTELTVEDIISVAGVSRSTFYKAFEGKGDLLAAWLARIIDDIDDSADAWWSLDGSATRDDLRDALAETYRAYQPHALLMGAVYEIAPFDPRARDAVADMVARGTGGLRRHIKRGQRDGWVDPDVRAEDAAVLLAAMSERGFQQLHRIEARAEGDRLLEAMADLVWHALYAHAPARA